MSVPWSVPVYLPQYKTACSLGRGRYNIARSLIHPQRSQRTHVIAGGRRCSDLVQLGVQPLNGAMHVLPLLPVAVSVLAWAADSAGEMMPVIGTYLEPWYTTRSQYHWSIAPAPHSCAGGTLLFADVDGDGDDDLLRAGCGPAGGGWAVSLSNGVDGWGNSTVWWQDGGPVDADRFAEDLDGDGAADAAMWSATSGWHAAFSDHSSAFGQPQHIFTMGCLAGSANCLQRVVSSERLWYITVNATGSSDDDRSVDWQTEWHSYNVSAKRADPVVRLAHPDAPFSPPFKQLFVADVSSDTQADAVAVDSGGNVFVAVGHSNGSFSPFRLGLANFTAARGAACSPGPLLLSIGSDTSDGGDGSSDASDDGSPMLVCANAASGYWYRGSINVTQPGEQEAAVQTWKYSHGGDMGGSIPPSSHGHPFGLRVVGNTYASFHLATMCPGCALAPLACNLTLQVCCVLPAEAHQTLRNKFDEQNFELAAPALKSTNANLWQAWHLAFEPALSGERGWGGYDSAGNPESASPKFSSLASISVNCVPMPIIFCAHAFEVEKRPQTWSRRSTCSSS